MPNLLHLLISLRLTPPRVGVALVYISTAHDTEVRLISEEPTFSIRKIITFIDYFLLVYIPDVYNNKKTVRWPMM